MRIEYLTHIFRVVIIIISRNRVSMTNNALNCMEKPHTLVEAFKVV